MGVKYIKEFCLIMETFNNKLPFFSYGLFKPKQLGYFRIKEYVKNTKIDVFIQGQLKERDGIPIYIENKNTKVKGCIIEFNDGEKAYERINEIEPDAIYDWNEIIVENTKVNILKGKKINKGVYDLEGVEEWDGKQDPLFIQGFELIKSIIDNNKTIKGNPIKYEYKPFFQLQMAYMFLWSIIERYAALRYHLGNRVRDKISQIEDEPYFKKCIEKYIDIKNRSIISLNRYGTSLNETFLNKDYSPLSYYFTLRSNVVHRGKSVPNEFDKLKTALNELYNIFFDVINNAFNEE